MLMEKMELGEEFENYLLSSFPIDRKELHRLLDEIGGYYSKTANEYIVARHARLQLEGHKNDCIFRKIKNELKRRRFIGPDLSIRQIRRIIYG